MRPQLDADEMAALRRRLLYARWLYQKGVAEAERDDELSHLVAITHFHSAVEIVLGNILVAYGWGSGAQIRQWKFEHMLSRAQQKAQEQDAPLRVPARTELISLSEMRSNILHRGHRYHREEVERARQVSRRFLADAVRGFFDEDIEAMSMSDLVENDYVRRLLHEAERRREEERYDECVALCVLVVELGATALAHGFGYLVRSFGDATEEALKRLLFLALGIDLRAAATFFSWNVRVGDATTMTPTQKKFRFKRHRTFRPGAVEARVALHCATDVALKVEVLGLGSGMTRRFPPSEWLPPGDWEQFHVDVPDEEALTELTDDEAGTEDDG